MPSVLFFVVQNNAIDNTVMRVNNKRKHARQMRANARIRTRFSTRVYAKIVRAFCVCKVCIPLTLVGYEMIIVNSALCASLAIYHLLVSPN